MCAAWRLATRRMPGRLNCSLSDLRDHKLWHQASNNDIRRLSKASDFLSLSNNYVMFTRPKIVIAMNISSRPRQPEPDFFDKLNGHGYSHAETISKNIHV